MKIHIVQRDDTFESIAERYSVSVQDLIGMNTHINHLAPLVPGLKVKVPSPARKEAPNVAQHIQKYYPNIDTETIDLQTASTAEPVAVKKVQPIPAVKKVEQMETVTSQPAVIQSQVVTPQPVVINQEVTTPQPTKVEEVIPIPLKPLPNEQPATAPNDGVKVTGAQKSVEEYKVSVNQGYYQGQASSTNTPPTPTPTPMPNIPPMPYPYPPSCSAGPAPYYPTPYPAPYPSPYQYPMGAPYANPYAMTRGQDDRFFVGGFGYPFFGGWGGYPFFGGYGWGGYPYYGGWGGYGYGGWRSPSSCSGGYPY